jgi:hypothetical protein
MFGGGGGEKGILKILTKKWNEFQKRESFESFESFGKLKRKKGFIHLINQKMMSFIKKEEP